MSILIAIILGFIQGVTEFLPVSSSGHVLIFSRILGDSSSFEFDVLVSFGTLFAVLFYYRKRFAQIIIDIFKRRDFRLASKLIIATIPAVIVGFVLQDFIERYLHNTVSAVVMLFVIGVIMVASTRWRPNKKLAANDDLHELSYRHVVIIGLVQCLSLISGSSRSGVTILAALWLGFNRKVAAEWSFLMSVPIIAGASFKVLLSHDGMQLVKTQTGSFLIANAISFVTGLIAIHILLKILQAKGLYWFGWYRIVLAVVLILLISVNILELAN